MSVDLILDGYNVMHLAGLARRAIRAGDLERARERLLAKLGRLLTEAERKRTTIVFDGTDQPAPGSRWFRRDEMAVLFSPYGAEADDVIEELIRAHRDPRRLLVVSSDNRLKTAARIRGARWLDSDGFLAEIEHRRPPLKSASGESSAPAGESTKGLSEEELVRWIDEFGEIDVQALRQEAERESRRNSGSTAKQPPAKPPGGAPSNSPTDPRSTPPQGPPTAGHSAGPRRPPSGKGAPSSEPAEPIPAEQSGKGTTSDRTFVDDADLDFWERRLADLLGDLERPDE